VATTKKKKPVLKEPQVSIIAVASLLGELRGITERLRATIPVGMCPSCASFQGGYCTHWAADVPEENYRDGCDHWSDPIPF
jgi:hypothetical protein